MPLRLSVAQTNQALLAWPLRTRRWPIPGYKGFWIRARPIGNGAVQPYLHPPGAQANATEPDGLYLFLHEGFFVDVLAIEVCGTQQNFFDKRARYQPGAGNTVCLIPQAWLHSNVTIQHGTLTKVWDATRWFSHAPNESLSMAIRHLRVLFALTSGTYNSWGINNGPAGHEYFCMHEHLRLTQNGNVREFLKGMALMKHFLRRPRW